MLVNPLIAPARSEAEPSLQEALTRAMQAGSGTQKCPLDPCENSLRFLQRYRLKIDGQDFEFGDAYKHLVPVYEDDHPVCVLMAGAQTGKTARLFVFTLRLMCLFWGALFGYYFPDYHLPKAFSSRRWAPMIREQEELAPWLGADSNRGKGEDRVLARTFGASAMFFLSTRGKSATEGLPLKGVIFDEVRKMARGDIERAEERYSAQRQPYDWKVSTACYPETDIHAYFLEGDQRYFHTACGCPDGIVLSLTWPSCCLDLRSAPEETVERVCAAYAEAGRPYLNMTEDEVAQYPPATYYCPKCDTILVDPRDGWWEPHNPGAYIHSYQMPQLLSPTYPAGRALHKWETNDDIQEVHNSMLGLPYLDESKRPVTEAQLWACVDAKLRWAAVMSDRWRRKYMINCSMGIDVQKGYNVVVVKKRAPNGKWRVVHIEVPEGLEKWRRCAELMSEYDVRRCLIDGAPEFDSAHRFALLFHGRVWLVTYGDSSEGQPIATWGDVHDPDTQRGPELKDRYTVVIARTKGLRWSLGQWTRRLNECPDPKALVVNFPVAGTWQDGRPKLAFTPFLRTGTRQPTYLCRDGYWRHLLSVIFEDVYADASSPGNEERKRRGQRKFVAVHLGGVDPHFAHADLFATVGLARV